MSATTVTPRQIKAARKLLGWSLTTLVKRSGQSNLVVSGIEDGAINQTVSANALKRIRGALEDAGIEFLPEGEEAGVRLRL